jgi:hypothetical protein
MRWLYLIIISFFSVLCSKTPTPEEEMMEGSITYPFVEEEKPLGINHQKEKFVIRSIEGNREYVLEIPGAGEDYEIEIPLSSLKGGTEASKAPDASAARSTDQELAGDAEVAAGDKPPPSYTIKINEIKDLYRKGSHELALIQVNELLAFYPSQGDLYLMKSTLLEKMAKWELAERSLLRAQELLPGNQAIPQKLTLIRERKRSH